MIGGSILLGAFAIYSFIHLPKWGTVLNVSLLVLLIIINHEGWRGGHEKRRKSRLRR